MNDYEYSEGIEFNGLMPKVMEADGVETIGKELQVVDFSGTAFGGNGGGVDDKHEYVDLGLPSGTLWSTENIKDANGEELYFAWGETQGYTSGQVGTDKYFTDFGENADYKYGTYNESNQENFGMTKYNKTDGKTELDSEDDAATANWGSDWKMPTKEQFNELIDNTEHEFTEVNGVQGAKFTSKVEGYTDKFLFFPAAGGAENGEVFNVGDYCYCWSVSFDYDSVDSAWRLSFKVGSCKMSTISRSSGFSVRPVRYQNI